MVRTIDITDFAEFDEEMHLPFLTGSRVYGDVKLTSDYDFVMLLEPYKIIYLKELGATCYPDGSVSYKNGIVNLIVVPTVELFKLWKRCTSDLAIRRLKNGPVPRAEVIAYLESQGLNNELDSQN